MKMFSTYDTEDAFLWLTGSGLIDNAYNEKDWNEFTDKVEDLLPHNCDIDVYEVEWSEIFNMVQEYKNFWLSDEAFEHYVGDNIEVWYRWKRGDYDDDCA